jgi:hypothetical protein
MKKFLLSAVLLSGFIVSVYAADASASMDMQDKSMDMQDNANSADVQQPAATDAATDNNVVAPSNDVTDAPVVKHRHHHHHKRHHHKRHQVASAA